MASTRASNSSRSRLDRHAPLAGRARSARVDAARARRPAAARVEQRADRCRRRARATEPSGPTTATCPEAGEHRIGDRTARRATPTAATTRSSACPSSNAHQPTHEPGRQARRAPARAVGAVRHHDLVGLDADHRVSAPAARAATGVAGGSRPSSAAATVSARRTGSRYRRVSPARADGAETVGAGCTASRAEPRDPSVPWPHRDLRSEPRSAPSSGAWASPSLLCVALIAAAVSCW